MAVARNGKGNEMNRLFLALLIALLLAGMASPAYATTDIASYYGCIELDTGETTGSVDIAVDVSGVVRVFIAEASGGPTGQDLTLAIMMSPGVIDYENTSIFSISNLGPSDDAEADTGLVYMVGATLQLRVASGNASTAVCALVIMLTN